MPSSTNAAFIASASRLAGHRIGRYELQVVLGVGAYGVVFLALDFTRPAMPTYYGEFRLSLPTHPTVSPPFYPSLIPSCYH